MQPQTALRTAAEIADHLCGLAYSCEGKSNWLAPVPRDDDTLDPPTWVNLGPELYDGSSGIALFLGEMFARAGDERLRATAAGGITHALGKLESEAGYARFGIYDGALGVAHVAARLAPLLDRPDLDRRARDVVRRVVQDLKPPFVLDVLSGAAGAIPVLLAMSERPGWPDLVPAAVRLGDAVLNAASREDIGWSWRATGFPRNLTGFSHGAAGIGWSLVRLYEHTGEARFLEGALAAFRYEDHWFDPGQDNWPDLRWEEDSDQPRFIVAWCHGAAGIGLSRLAALGVCHDESLKRDAEAAVRASKRNLIDPDAAPDADFCLCHGRAGIASFLLLAGERLDDTESREIAVATAKAAADSHGGAPGDWPACPGQMPTLMNGLAGIGYFYLGLADPELPCLLQLT